MYLSNTAIWIIPQILYRIDRIPQDAQKSGYGPVWSDFLCHPRADPIFGYIHVVTSLKVEPESGALTEIAAQPQRQLSRH